MNAWVDDALFKPSAARTLDLLALLRTAAEHEHGLLIATRPFGSDSPAFEAWHAELRGQLQREVQDLRDAFRADPVAINGAGPPVLITQSPPQRPRPGSLVLGLARAIRLLGTPFAVMLEHAVHDGRFLLRVLPPETRARLESWLHKGLLIFENGGGGALPELVGYFGNHPPELGSGLTAEEWRRRHFFVVDRDEEQGRQGQMARKLEAACTSAGIPAQFHVTVRRSQESYRPRAAVNADVAKRLGGAGLQKMQQDVEAHFKAADRHWRELPRAGQDPFFKKTFMSTSIAWAESWFDADGSRVEFARVAERIAALR